MRQRPPRLTIPTRIFLSIVLVLLAFGVVSGASLYQHQRTAARLRLLHEGYLPLALTLGQAKASQAVFEMLLDRLLFEPDPGATRWRFDHARGVRIATVRRALTGIERALRLDPSEEDRSALAEVRALLTEIQETDASAAEYQHLFAALAADEEGEASRTVESLRSTERQISRRLRRAWGQVQGQIAATSRTAAEQENRFVYVVALLALLALLTGLAVLWWSQRLLAPLPRLQRRVAAVAGGDFDGRIEASRDDEIGQLTQEFERMVEAVGARDRQLRDAADTLRELQKMQEQIVAGLRAGVMVVDSDGVVRSANRAARQVLRLGPDAVGEPLTPSPLVEALPALLPAVDSVAEGGERGSIAAAPFFGDDAEPRYLDVLVTPFGVEETEGPRRSVLVVADDVTLELRTKQRLIQTERLAAIGRMAALVTHEVRNPLSSIGLNVELLEEELAEAGSESRDLLRSIQREIDRLTGLTEEYLRLARLPSPRLEPEDLSEIVGEVGRFVTREFETSDVRLAVELDEHLPLVAADEPQVRQALLNLLRNARESMPEGGEVVLSAKGVAGGVEIRVVDAGEGIEPAKRAHIFDLFYSTKDRGTGLGLPLTQQIIAAHGGTIECTDAEGGGTAFTIWFPSASEEERAAPPAAAE